MKLLPEVPTEEMLTSLTEDCDESGNATPLTPDIAYQRLYAAAPEMKDEPVAFARTFDGEMITDSLTMFLDTAERELSRMNAEFPDVDRREIVPLYRCPPEVEALKAEIERLKKERDEGWDAFKKIRKAFCDEKFGDRLKGVIVLTKGDSAAP